MTVPQQKLKTKPAMEIQTKSQNMLFPVKGKCVSNVFIEKNNKTIIVLNDIHLRNSENF